MQFCGHSAQFRASKGCAKELLYRDGDVLGVAMPCEIQVLCLHRECCKCLRAIVVCPLSLATIMKYMFLLTYFMAAILLGRVRTIPVHTNNQEIIPISSFSSDEWTLKSSSSSPSVHYSSSSFEPSTSLTGKVDEGNGDHLSSEEEMEIQSKPCSTSSSSPFSRFMTERAVPIRLRHIPPEGIVVDFKDSAICQGRRKSVEELCDPTITRANYRKQRWNESDAAYNRLLKISQSKLNGNLKMKNSILARYPQSRQDGEEAWRQYLRNQVTRNNYLARMNRVRSRMVKANILHQDARSNVKVDKIDINKFRISRLDRAPDYVKRKQYHQKYYSRLQNPKFQSYFVEKRWKKKEGALHPPSRFSDVQSINKYERPRTRILAAADKVTIDPVLGFRVARKSRTPREME